MSDVKASNDSVIEVNEAIMSAVAHISDDFSTHHIISGMSSCAAVALGRFFGPGELDEAEVFGIISEFTKAYEATARLAYHSALKELAAMTEEERQIAFG